MQNFPQQFEALLSQKKTFFIFLISFLKYALDWEDFEKKCEYPSLVISKIIDSERGGYLNVLKGLASEHHSIINVLTGPNTAEMSLAPLLTYFLMNSR